MGNNPCQFADEQMLNKEGPWHSMSEDCLYLNIWAPKNSQKAPVFVYIYDGGYHYEGAS